MKNYIQFYHLSTGWNSDKKDFSGPYKNIPKCGTAGAISYDGRMNLNSVIQEAEDYLRRTKKVFTDATGYIIFRNGRKIYTHFNNDLKVD